MDAGMKSYDLTLRQQPTPLQLDWIEDVWRARVELVQRVADTYRVTLVPQSRQAWQVRPPFDGSILQRRN